MATERESLEEAVQSSDLKRSLVAMRDYIAHQLEANLCKTCLNSRLRTGDQASLLLRLQKVLEDLAAMVTEGEAVDPVDDLFARRALRQGRRPDTPDTSQPTERGERRTGSRRTGGDSGSAP